MTSMWGTDVATSERTGAAASAIEGAGGRMFDLGQGGGGQGLDSALSC